MAVILNQEQKKIQIRNWCIKYELAEGSIVDCFRYLGWLRVGKVLDPEKENV